MPRYNSDHGNLPESQSERHSQARACEIFPVISSTELLEALPIALTLVIILNIAA